MQRLFFILCIGCLLSGCFSLNALKDAQPSGESFTKALTHEYTRISEVEAYAHDWGDADFFAEKGLRAAKGVQIDPEHPEDWNVPPSALSDLREARRLLLDTVTGTAIALAPEESARAYVYYDCWVEEQEESWQEDHIASCRERFFETLNAVSMVLDSVKVKETAKETEETTIEGMPWQEPKEEIPVVEIVVSEPELEKEVATVTTTVNLRKKPDLVMEPDDYLILFDWNRSDITTQGQQVVSRVAQSLRDVEGYAVIVTGHADRSGAEDYNLVLSRNRAEKIKTVLVQQGVREAAIQVFGFGESDPVVPTADGVAHPKNRRVQIIVQ